MSGESKGVNRFSSDHMLVPQVNPPNDAHNDAKTQRNNNLEI